MENKTQDPNLLRKYRVTYFNEWTVKDGRGNLSTVLGNTTNDNYWHIRSWEYGKKPYAHAQYLLDSYDNDRKLVNTYWFPTKHDLVSFLSMEMLDRTVKVIQITYTNGKDL